MMSARGWEAVTFEGVRRAQLRDQMRLTPAERLRWLEEALEFVARVRRIREPRASSGEPSEAHPRAPNAPPDAPPG